MKRVVHMITGLEVGGAEQMLLKILPRLNKKGLQNVVFCLKGHGPIGKKLKEQGVDVYYLGYEHFYQLPLIEWKFMQLVRSVKPDVLVTYLIHADLFGRVMGRLTGIRKIVAYEHGSLLQWEFLRYVDRLTSFMVTHYLTVSLVLQEQLIQKYHFPSSKIQVLRNGIEIECYAGLTERGNLSLRNSIGLTSDAILFGIIANLRAGKGHNDLLTALRKLLDSIPKSTLVTLLIIGDGDEKEILMRRMHELGLKKHVLFLGFREDIPALLSILDIFVLPTYFEGMSVAILEAMASRKAIVTTNIVENKELVQDKISALLVSPGDIEALAQAMKQLVLDEKLRLHLGKTAYDACVKHFTLEKTIHDYKEFLLTI